MINGNGIYAIINLSNSKVYIGQTTVSFKKRWQQHRRELIKNTHHNQHLQYAWNKYGNKSFIFEIVYKQNSIKDDLDFLEKYFISKHKTVQYGYNISKGGKGIKKDTKIKMSKAKKGYIPWNKGKTGLYVVSEETKKKISESTKRHPSIGGENHSQSIITRKEAIEICKRLSMGESVSSIGKDYTKPIVSHIYYGNSWQDVSEKYLIKNKKSKKWENMSYDEILALYSKLNNKKKVAKIIECGVTRLNSILRGKEVKK